MHVINLPGYGQYFVGSISLSVVLHMHSIGFLRKNKQPAQGTAVATPSCEVDEDEG